MTEKQWRFLKGFTLHGNATKAARQAGYSPNGVNRMGYYLKWRLRYEIKNYSLSNPERRQMIDDAMRYVLQTRRHRLIDKGYPRSDTDRAVKAGAF